MIKKILKTLSFLLFITLCIEASAYLLYPIIGKKSFSYKDAAVKRKEIAETKPLSIEQALAGKEHIIHPYQGFVNNPQDSEVTISNFGFMDDKSPLEKRSENNFNIGVFGGSVAWWFGSQGGETLIKGLKKIPSLSKRAFTITNLAIGAYKQPQQLSTLSFMLSQGAKFDLVINLDGFNEIALSPNQINSVNVYPFFPYNWHLLAKDVPNRKIQSMIGKTVVFQELRKKIANFFLKPIFTKSAAIAVAWELIDRKVFISIETSRARLNNQKVGSKEVPYSSSGPKYKNESKEKLFKDISDVWLQSSFLMKELVEAQGGKYIHFLQPNQYNLDSKPMMSDEEKKIALVLEANPSFFNVNVPPGYKVLKSKVPKLRDKDINFFDLSYVFKEIKEPVYLDSCCHLNLRGNKILATQAVKHIKPLFSNQQIANKQAGKEQ